MENTERKFPIYSFSFAWTADGDQNDSTGFTKMFREDQSQEDLDAFVLNSWNNYIITPSRLDGATLVEKNPQLTRINAKYIEHETWSGGWFQHSTFNTHLTDEELYHSFNQFVYRKERIIDAAGGKYATNLPYCLMGADDRWRWKGPCRCEHCIKKGIVLYDH